MCTAVGWLSLLASGVAGHARVCERNCAKHAETGCSTKPFSKIALSANTEDSCDWNAYAPAKPHGQPHAGAASDKPGLL